VNFLKKKIKEISVFQIISIYIVCLIFFYILCAVYANLYLNKFPYYIDSNNNIVLKSLPFDIGNLLHNLYYNSEYVQKVRSFNIDFHLAVLPFYPLFLLFLAKINLSFYFIFLAKNTIIFSIIFFSCLVFLKDLNKCIYHFLLLLFLFWYNPYNTHVLLTLDFSDTFVSTFFPIIFLLVLSKNINLNFLFSIFVFALYLLKPSLWLFCILFPLIVLILNFIRFNYHFKKIFIFPILFVSLAISLWGFFGLKKANYFPIGTSSTSTSTYYLSSMLNHKFNDHYPDLSLDLLLDLEKGNKFRFKNEKDLYFYYKNRNIEFLKDNYIYYLKGAIKKINFIFFGIHSDGKMKKEESKIRFSNFPNKLLLLMAIIVSAITIIKTFFMVRKIPYPELIFLFMLSLYIAPYIVAWATTKHLVSIFLLSKIYLFSKFFNCLEK